MVVFRVNIRINFLLQKVTFLAPFFNVGSFRVVFLNIFSDKPFAAKVTLEWHICMALFLLAVFLVVF